ncbi:unnamed protein product [Paramecium sonneborni]|uniref:Transmembrane protein n=1 Tax=Paramecium sonneborni TaxID=65129 RepID=A0A8S1RS69_9CILI|nr:unnamed protein product [Paramecium sonneborni]
MIILINSAGQIILTLVDVIYSRQLIQNIQQKCFKKQQALTQFEANQLYSTEINFNQKRNDNTILVFICGYYGFLLPICYPITLISNFDYCKSMNLQFYKNYIKLSLNIDEEILQQISDK